MPWPFDLGFMQRALIAGVAVAAAAPLIGAFLVQKRMSLMGDGIGHIAFAGVAAGLLLDVWPVWSALVVAVAGALGIEWLRRSGVAGDLALAVFFYGGLAGGAVIAQSADRLNASILEFLFGAPLTVTTEEIWIIVGLGVGIAATIAVVGRALFAVVLDEEAARVAGLPVDGLNALLAVLVAVTVVVAMRIVGILLVAALMVLPVGAAQAIARSFRGTLVGGAAIGVASVVIGLTIAREAPVAPGGTIVLVATAAFLLAGVIWRRRPTPMPRGPAVPGMPPAEPPGHGH